MGQIVRRKRKGRPSSNSDPPRRNSSASPPLSSRRPRRSRRARSVRYNFDIDDYVDDDEFYDEVVGRREKKLRLLLDEDDSNRRVAHAPSSSSSSSSPSSDDYDEVKPSKKRKIDGDDSEDEEEDGYGIEEMQGRKPEEDEEYDAGAAYSVPGTPSDLPKEIPLPDKRILELILDKLQKKDIYGVYAEPVDPDELPDYHEVIKHPMDFATVRKKLAKETYLTLDQFESDVLLISSNAMQYNSPDTIYYKQASSIQELAKRKFERLRANVDRSEIELKSGPKPTYSFQMPKKQPKKSIQMVQDPVGSDLSSGPTRAKTGEFQNDSSAAQVTSVRPGSGDGLMVENSSLTDQDKGEDFQPGKGFVSRPGRKPFVHDENRRATFNVSIEPIIEPESICSIFEGESKQFIPVGLHAEHSYARSLARFSATLGSVAWKVASQRIELALPEGLKFGRGWVGEYEPLPTPVLMPGHCTLENTDFLTKFHISDENASKNTFLGDEKASRNLIPGNEKTSTSSARCKEPVDIKRSLRKPSGFGNNSGTNATIPVKHESTSEMRPPFSSSLQGKPYEVARNFIKPEKKGSSQVEQIHPTDSITPRHVSNASNVQSPGPAEVVSRNHNTLSSTSFSRMNSNNGGFGSGGQGNKTLVSSASLIHTNSNNDGFGYGGQGNKNLGSSASFSHMNSNNGGFASEGRNNRNLLSSASFKQPSSNNDGFAPEGRSNRNLSTSASFNHTNNNDGGFASVGRNNRNLLPSASFKQTSSNNDGFAPEGRINRNLSSSASFEQQVNSNKDGFASEGRINRNHSSSASFEQMNSHKDGFAPEGRINRNRSSSASFEQTNSNKDGFAPEGRTNRNLSSSASFEQTNSNKDGFAPEGRINRNLSSSASFEQMNSNKDGICSRGQSNAKPTSVGLDCNQIARIEQQGLSDPVQMMRMLTGKPQHPQVYSNSSPVASKLEDSNGLPLTAPQFALKAQHQQIYANAPQFVPKRDPSNSVAFPAAGAWMSLGGAGGVIRPQMAGNTVQHTQHTPMDSLYDRQPPQISQFRGEFPAPGYPHPIHSFVSPQPVRMSNESHPAVLPQLVTADLSRFQVQSSWRGVSPQMQQQPPPPRGRQQESRPPDLNIGYQSVGSPVRQSSGMLMDSQQPDLALQL